MEQFWTLLKVHLKLKFGFNELRHNFKANPKKARKTLGMGLLILFVICYVLGFYGFVAYSMIDAAKTVHMEGLILAITILAAQLVVLIFGIFYMMGLYHSKDMELLASLPVTPGKVFTVKFIMALLSEIGTFALVTAPIFVIYGAVTGAALSFYLKSIVVILFGALLPMAISGFIAALLW
jgi:ABC-2 type transport system permease protein